MIAGWFNEVGRPYVEGRVIIPRLRVNHANPFLVDTGADSTCIHPSDAREVGIPFPQLGNRRGSRGIGGMSQYFLEPAIISFEDGNVTRLYAVELLIAEPNESNDGLPSLLGRNIINNWRMVYDPTNGVLEFTARRADRTLGI